MSYIELINYFWDIDEEWQFTCCETRLYFYLVKTANRLGWVDSWTRSDAKVSSDVGVSVNSMKTARNRLVQAGLIDVKQGGKGQRDKTRYQILIPKPQPNHIPNLIPNLEPKVQPYNKTKTKTESMGLFPPPPEDKPKRQPKARKPEFIPPTPDEVREYFRGRLPDWEEQAATFYDHYDSLNWHTATGAKVQRWEGRANLWISEEKLKPHEQRQDNPADRRRADKAAKIRQLADEYAAIGAGTDVGGDPPEIPDL